MSGELQISAMGIDPDTLRTGMAVVTGQLNETPRVIWVASADVSGSASLGARARHSSMAERIWQHVLKAPDADLVVVEGQAHRRGDPRPDDIVQLGVVQGIAAGVAYQNCDGAQDLYMPLPTQWKGTSRKKKQYQEHLLQTLSLDEELSGVPGAEDMNPVQRGHVVDAIGLAVWGFSQRAFEIKKKRMLG